MTDPQNESQSLTRRTLLLGGGGLGFFGVLATRLYYLQVLEAENYASLSEDNRFNYNIIVPSRGRILDRNGVELAVNDQNYGVVIIPEQISDLDLTLDKLSAHLTISDRNRGRIKQEVRENPKFVPVMVEDNLEWETFAALNMETPDLPGVIPQVGEGRAYPFGGIFAHTLGYVGRAGPEAVAANPDPLLRQPTFRIGKTGVELATDGKLRGKSGKLKVEVNAVGRIVREWPDPANMSEKGDDVWLTLDADLQKYAAELYEEDSGGGGADRCHDRRAPHAFVHADI